MNYETLIKGIDSHQCISFDIFDTLVLRNVPMPEDVFRIVYGKVGDLFPGVDCDDFVAERRKAETRARTRYKLREVTLDEIYSEFGIVRGFEEQVMETEILAELDVCVPNLALRAVFKACLEKNKLIVLVSDMYLPRRAVEQILGKCGIVGYRYLFLSSEWGLTKRAGGLFDEVALAFDIRKHDILHIGDSYRSDWLIPQAHGLDAYWVNRKESLNRYLKPLISSKSFNARALACAIMNTCPIDSNAYYQFGYMCFGPLLFGFCDWLRAELLKSGIDRVYFLARDGYIIKRAFDCLEHVGIDSEYLEVSRRSLRVPIIWIDDSFSAFLDMITPSKLIKIQAIFDGLGLQIEDYDELLGGLGMDCNTVFYRDEEDSLSYARRLFEGLAPDAVRQSRTEFQALCAYVKQRSIGGRFAIVDIGWSGGMQRYLSMALDAIGIEHEICGYYMGVVDYARRNTAVHGLDLNGYLFNCLEGEKDTRRFFVGLMESLFLEQRGSVSHYELRNDGSVATIRYPYEYIEGGILAREALSVREIQRGALDMMSMVCSSSWIRSLKLSYEDAFCGVRKVGLDPTKTDISMFGWFRFFDEGSSFLLASPKSLASYFGDYTGFKKDFLSSRWKVGFAKELLGGLPLPYSFLFDKVSAREDHGYKRKLSSDLVYSSSGTVDILLATYNGEEYLVEQLESILGQTFVNWRVLVSDDGSTDGTMRILEEYAERDSRIIVLKNGHDHQGAKDNFLFLLASSSADYVMFCDQDDIWEPNKVERALALMHKRERQSPNEALALFSDLYVVDENASLICPSFEGYLHNNPYRIKLYHILVQNPACGCAMTINREAIDLLCRAYEGDSRLIRHHDWLAMLVASAFGTVLYDNVPGVRYRQHRANTVGARGFSIMGRLRDRSSSENNFIDTIEQASNFVLLYRDYLTEDQRRRISYYLDLLETDSVLRGWTLLVKSRCLKSGVRKLAQLIMVFRVVRINRRRIEAKL